MRMTLLLQQGREGANDIDLLYDPGSKPMRMPELTLPPPSPPALLREGAALGVWRLHMALQGHETAQAGQWYRGGHALAADRHCIILVLPRCDDSADIMLRFGDQVGDLGALSHPVIKVPCDSGITADGRPYLVFDACDGQAIERACQNLPLRERMQLIVDLCEALRYAHQQGWLLGEIDPSLLWVGKNRQLKLMGLGLLRIPDPAEPFERGLTLASAPGFASPEALAGKAPSFASEVFGLGVLACLLVDGRLPSEPLGDGNTLLPAASWPGLSALERFSLDALLRKAVAAQAGRRYAGAEALAEDLRSWLDGEAHSALVLTPMPLLPAPAPNAAIAYESSVPAWPPQQKLRRRALWLGLVLAGMAVVPMWLWFGPQAWRHVVAVAVVGVNAAPQQGLGAAGPGPLTGPMISPNSPAAKLSPAAPLMQDAAPAAQLEPVLEASPAPKPVLAPRPIPLPRPNPALQLQSDTPSDKPAPMAMEQAASSAGSAAALDEAGE